MATPSKPESQGIAHMLDEIIARKKQELSQARSKLPLEALKERVSSYQAERSFRDALTQEGKLALIGELKRKSPSKGMLRERFDPVSLAQMLQEAGADALSVLTDEPYFGGHLDFLRDVKAFTELPILRKDFILEPYQVYEAAYYQADAVLLIVRILTESQLSSCMKAAVTLGIEPFVEVHSEEDLKIDLSAEAHVIGINQRNLQTFRCDTQLAARLIPKIPSGKVIVAESGVQCASDVKHMKALGIHALLIGEALMTAPDPVAKVRELFRGTWI